jgi:hypothetical protein
MPVSFIMIALVLVIKYHYPRKEPLKGFDGLNGFSFASFEIPMK